MNISLYDNYGTVEENKYSSDLHHSGNIDTEASFIDAGLSDVSTLGKLEGITTINLHCNQLTSLQGLPNLPSVMELNLSSNQFKSSDIEGLMNLPNLRILDLSGNNISTLTGLPYMPFLERFSAAFNNIFQMDGIDGFPALVELDMRGNRLASPSSFSGLETLSHLEELTLAGADGRNANPICGDPDAVVQLFDMYCYFGAIDERHRQEWVSPKKHWVRAIAASSGRVLGKGANTSEITPKFDAVVQNFLRRARGGNDSGDGGVSVIAAASPKHAGVRQYEDDEVSDVTSIDVEVSGRKEEMKMAPARDMLTERGEGRRMGSNPWLDSDHPSTQSKIPPMRSKVHPSPRHKSSSSVIGTPCRSDKDYGEGIAAANESSQNVGSSSPNRVDDSRFAHGLEDHAPRPISGIETHEVNTQTDECLEGDCRDANEVLETLQHEIDSLQGNVRTIVFAASVGRTAIESTSKREVLRTSLRLWRRNTSCLVFGEEKNQLLQENQLLRLASERANKTADATKVLVENDMEYLRRALAEEKVRSESLKKQVVKQEAIAQAQRKELIQSKKMMKDLEESLTTKCDEEKSSAEAHLASVINKSTVDIADLQGQLSAATSERDEYKDICSHLKGQIQSLCDQLKAAQSEECAKCPTLEQHLKECRLQIASLENEVLDTNRLQSEMKKMEEKCARLEELDSQRCQLIDEWKVKYEHASKSLADGVGEKKKLEKQLNKVAAGYAALRSENGKLRDDYVAVSDENSTHMKAVSELRAISQELKDALRKKNERCKILESRLSGGADSVEVGAQERGSLREQLQSALEQIEFLRRDREEMDKALSDSEAKSLAEIHDLEENIKNLELSIRVKEKMIDDLNVSTRRMREKVREDEVRMAEAMKNLEREVEELRDEVSDLERALELAKEDEVNAQFQLEECKAGRDKVIEDMKSTCEQEVEVLKDRLKARDDDIE